VISFGSDSSGIGGSGRLAPWQRQPVDREDAPGASPARCALVAISRHTVSIRPRGACDESQSEHIPHAS
jgi:hypothetical protein